MGAILSAIVAGLKLLGSFIGMKDRADAKKAGQNEQQVETLNTTIEAKKFFEVQKAIMLTGHIVDGLTTQIAPHVWNKLSDAEKKMFTEVTQQAAVRASAKVKAREAELV